MTDDDFTDFYRRTVDGLYRYASRLTGNDRAATDELVQDTYLQLVRRVRTGPIDVDFGWLAVTCRHRHIDRLRADQRRRVRELRALPPDAEAPATGGSADVLAALPADQRAALVLHYVDDLPVTAVAAELHRSVHATESLLARGRATVRRRLAATTRPGAQPADHEESAR